MLPAWGAYVLARSYPTERYTYGFRSTSILAALLNSVILLIATGAIAWEAIQRLLQPQTVEGSQSSSLPASASSSMVSRPGC